ncbi:protein HIRA homolog isoform X1 [Neodiprion lecontei]|uniref:Protein HIRA n=2 Tax=Neodiprion lecontei TaxID=441921 RepID=A0ABM3FV71_NEOLC|nr:protein HIRA homolog isoform X1 [Neodiprion pinetum]XP_046591914.1 protein HIRA homolog isoform X1 [Neodiprion lecontei]
MKLLKPNWVTHDEFPIFSVDIHPDGKRFATGGQGGDSGRVVIWNMQPIIDESAEINQNVPRMLCQLDNHLACVNCVRWSSGGLLASGGDDKLIMIWRLSGGSGGSSIFGSKAGVETWRCIATLRSHEGDVLDLAWAPHSPWLASASVDNSVIIWDASKFPAVVAVLKGHTGLVKGVTWDPVGKYLASQSDDKTLRVWRTTDWAEEALISEPFEECGGTTHVLRLSWSPDGQYLVSAHAMNGGGPTAQIIERDGWTQDKDFVGHRKAVTCVRFNGNILQKKPPGSTKPQQYCCVAIGSRDRSLSVWLTSLKRPLVVVHELFTHSVLDASWSPCGLRLAACSWDGSVVFIEFTQQELGQPLDHTEQNLEPAAARYSLVNSNEINLNKKIECVQQGSKQSDVILQSTLHERMYGKPLVQGGCMVMEAPELLNLKPPAPPSQPCPPRPVPANNTPPPSITSTPAKGPINKQIETRTSDGRRRITPMFIPPPPDTMDTSIGGGVGPPTFTSTSQTKSSIIIEKRDDVVTPNVSSALNATLPATPVPTLTLKRREQTASKPHHSTLSKRLKLVAERSANHIVFPAIKPSSSLSQQAGHYAVTVTSSQGLAHLQVFRGTDSEPIWELYLGYNAVALAASPAVIVLALEDGSIHTFHPAKGSRPAPPLAPPAPLAKLYAIGNMVMVISSCGAVRVWEFGPSPRLIVSTSAVHLVSPGASLLSCTIHNGMPHLSFTNARAYIYHKEMGTWLLIGDNQDPVWRWSSQVASSTSGGRAPRGPLSSLQEALQRTAGSAPPHPRPPHSAPSVVAYLEQQLLASKALGSSQEYVHWLMALVSFLLTQDGLEKRLRIILDDLLGPSHGSAAKSAWEPTMLGMNKHKLLSDVLAVVGGHLRWQRLYLEYAEQLAAMKQT